MFPSRKSPWTTVGERLGEVRCEPAADLFDVGQLARLVDLPELREAPHLALEVAPRPCERRQLRPRHVGGVDLDQRVDQVEAEP